MTTRKNRPKSNRVRSVDGQSAPQASPLAGTDASELWFREPIKNRTAAAFHAGRLANLFEWQLALAWLLGSRDHFDAALAAFCKIAGLLPLLSAQSDTSQQKKVKMIRVNLEGTWHAEWAADAYWAGNSAIEMDFCTTRVEQCRELLFCVGTNSIDDVRTLIRGVLSEEEKWIYDLGDCLDQVLRPKDVFHFVWKEPSPPPAVDATGWEV